MKNFLVGFIEAGFGFTGVMCAAKLLSVIARAEGYWAVLSFVVALLCLWMGVSTCKYIGKCITEHQAVLKDAKERDGK